jgi:hypothetical protein
MATMQKMLSNEKSSEKRLKHKDRYGIIIYNGLAKGDYYEKNIYCYFGVDCSVLYC